MTPEKQQAITFHLHEALRMMGLERKIKNISGWTVTKSGGYFRAFKKVGGKLQGVYLGKNLNDAETKIKAKEIQMAGDPG